MSKKDYERIAGAIQTAIVDARSGDISDSPPEAGAWRAASEIARALAAENPRFDHERFLRACEPGANVRARG